MFFYHWNHLNWPHKYFRHRSRCLWVLITLMSEQFLPLSKCENESLSLSKSDDFSFNLALTLVEYYGRVLGCVRFLSSWHQWCSVPPCLWMLAAIGISCWRAPNILMYTCNDIITISVWWHKRTRTKNRSGPNLLAGEEKRKKKTLLFFFVVGR